MSIKSRQGGPSAADDEPPTRLLQARELQEHLRRAAIPEPDTSALTRVRVKPEQRNAVTRWARPASRERPPASAATATSLDASELRAALPRLGAASQPLVPPTSLTTAPVAPSSQLTRNTRRWPSHGLRLLLLSGVTVLAVSWVGARSFRQAKGLTPARVGEAAPAAPVDKPLRAAGPAPALPVDAPRRALDLLLAGRTRDALDAYRALTLVHPSHGAFARTVRLLEHELRDCGAGGASCR